VRFGCKSRKRNFIPILTDAATVSRIYLKDGKEIWTVASDSLETPANLLSIIPAVVFQTRVNLAENKFIIDYVNKGAAEFIGADTSTFNPALFSVDDFFPLVHQCDLQTLTDGFAASTRNVARYNISCRMNLPSTGLRWVNIVADPDPRPKGWVIWRGVVTDITEIKSAEEELRRAQERFELAVQTGGIGVWDLDLATGKCVWDKRMHEFYGVDRDAFDGSMAGWRDLLRIEDREETPRNWNSVLLSGEVLDCEFQIDRPNGVARYMRGLSRLIRGADGTPQRVVGINVDITERRELQNRLEYMAEHDALTGLPNRRAFEQKLKDACDQAHGEGRQHVLCFMDLDRFKIVNDSAGHAAGDAFLRTVGHLIQTNIADQTAKYGADFTARLGGDEFALLFYDCSTARAEHRARKLIDAIRTIRLSWEGKVYDIGASIGLTAIGPKLAGPVELMSQADVACYAAKAAGRNQVLLYGGRNRAAERHHREILAASGIRRAIEAGQFELFAQDILTLDHGKTQGRHVEILLRMKDASGRILRPGSFIPAAERYDLMGNLDRWVLENALLARGKALAAVEDLSISINLSANSLNDPSFWQFLDETLAASPIPAGRVNFEITETAMIGNLESARNFMSVVRAAGHALILDDFGTGLSSFNYLKQFPIDGLKIDGSFIRQLKDSPVDRIIVESINQIAQRLGIVTVAEFVEDAETLAIVRAIGIDRAQGYIIGRPVSLDAMIGSEYTKLAGFL
jgi:diguanylate cyclase (GGDEF)-like protein/PAS domain S-box-containing protein